MKTLKLKERVRSKANPIFVGTVVEVSRDGRNGYVHFDADEENTRIFFDVSELELENAK